jgi:uncharacterized membrane protein YbhN (UPF0104 family)
MSDIETQDGSNDSSAPPAIARWYRRTEIIGLVILIAVTAWGIHKASGDWSAVVDYWKSKLPLLPFVLGLAIVDVACGAVGWAWVYERFGIRAADGRGARVFLAGYAGLFLPAQLGRLIRPDAMVRLRRGGLGDCYKAEAAAFVLDATSVVVLLASLAAWRMLHPLLGLVTGVAVIVVCLFLGNQIAERLSDTKLVMPPGFWWSPKTLAVILIQLVGWVAHGAAFYVLVLDLPGSAGLWDALFFAPAAAVLGIGTGLPGGVGATEGFLGAFLSFSKVPQEHLALVISAFRVVTFWIWIPLGWLALAVTRRRSDRRSLLIQANEEAEALRDSKAVLADVDPS